MSVSRHYTVRPPRSRRMARGIPAVAPAARRGSVLLVVVGMLGLLLLLGFMFFSFAQHEQTGAQTFSDGAKVIDPEVDGDVLWDWALEQLLIGPDTSLGNSALYGNRHSLISTMFGNGRSPYSGEGIHLILDPANPTSGKLVVDQINNTTGALVPDGVADISEDTNGNGILDGSEDANGNGNLDLGQDLLKFNFSASTRPNGRPGEDTNANGVLDSGEDINGNGVLDIGVPISPSPGVDYTTADHNSLFLSYMARVPNSSGTYVNVMIPSFMRAHMLRKADGSYMDDWRTNAQTARMVLRPHPNHVIAGTNTALYTSDFPMSPSDAAYNYDVDNDGLPNTPAAPGVPGLSKEGIWINLDYPAQQLPDGTFYIPMFSFTVKDLDGTINLNTAGNTAGLNIPVGNFNLVGTNLQQPVGQTFPVSRSNQGLSQSEVNPIWGMTVIPPTAGSNSPLTLQHREFYSWDPANRLELANMEFLYCVWGRPHYDSAGNFVDLVVGRYGDRERLLKGINSGNFRADFPRPGTANVDDNYDQQEGEQPFLVAIGRQFSHPLDYSGAGSMWKRGTFTGDVDTGYQDAYGRLSSLFRPNVTTPNRWLQYTNYHTQGSVKYALIAPWGAGGDSLMKSVDTNGQRYNTLPDYATNWLLDDPAEMIVEPSFANRTDDYFTVDEVAPLHSSPNDPDAATVVSRLKALMPLNFSDIAVREAYTSTSWDRDQFGLPHFPGQRFWEFNADTDGDGLVEFPPVSPLITTYGGTTTSKLAAERSVGQVREEAIRPELRKYLHIERFDSSAGGVQRRWDIRKFLTSTQNQTATGSPYGTSPTAVAQTYQQMNVFERTLTVHPTQFSAGEISNLQNSATSGNMLAYPTAQLQYGTNADQYEFWARRDRQQMARDIYTMLYMFGGGNDALDYTTSNSGRTLYTDAQLLEMAQFAVNVVDAQDTDEVATVFEYDKDLSDGWNLGDNPYPFNNNTNTTSGTVAGTYPNKNLATDLYPLGADDDSAMSSADRGVVMGVEAQTLAFNETLFIRQERVLTAGIGMDHVATLFDDSDMSGTTSPPATAGNEARFYAFVELANVSPYTFNTSDAWQVRLFDPVTPATLTRRLTLRNSTVSAGSTHTIGSRSYNSGRATDANAGVPLPSVFAVNSTYDPGAGDTTAVDASNYQTYQIAPPPNQVADVDTVLPGHSGYYDMWDEVNGTQINGTNGSFLNNGQADSSHELKLYRRAQPGMAPPTGYYTSTATRAAFDQINPWIEVDKTTARLKQFQLSGTTATSAEILPQLQNLKSRERYQPLDGVNAPIDFAGAGTTIFNSIKQTNNRTQQIVPTSGIGVANAYTLHQPHFDRDFATIMELLWVPLYGPDNALAQLSLGTPGTQAKVVAAPTAQVRFLQPLNPNGLGANQDNRWHRLLEFLQVTDRYHHQYIDQSGYDIKQQMTSKRVPGKINLNMLRHRGTLMGLLDDPQLFNRMDTNDPPLYQDNLDSSRDWLTQFFVSRDGLNYYGAGTAAAPGVPNNVFIPGAPGSRPFRALTYIGQGTDSVEHTLLRSLPMDNALAVADRRRLFEVGNSGDHTDPSQPYFTDPMTRHRLLAKIQGNSTNRSHVFAVWCTVGFFEATETASGSGKFQIGRELSDPSIASPTIKRHRMFSVVDRSAAEKALNKADGTFNFKPLVVYQRTIE